MPIDLLASVYSRANPADEVKLVAQPVDYRRPSVKTMLGVTKAKKRVKKDLGITAAMRPFRAPGNMERHVLRQAGYYSGPMKFFRFLGRVFK